MDPIGSPTRSTETGRLALVCLSALITACVVVEGPRASTDLYIGLGASSPADHLAAGQRGWNASLGFTGHFGRNTWPVAVTAGAQLSGTAVSDLVLLPEDEEESLSDLTVGAVGRVRMGPARIFFGAGAAWTFFSEEFKLGDRYRRVSDSSPGGFIELGAVRELSGGWKVGVQMRYVGWMNIEFDRGNRARPETVEAEHMVLHLILWPGPNPRRSGLP